MRVTHSSLNAVHGGENTIQIDRNSTSFSLNLGNNDVHESGMQVLDSTPTSVFTTMTATRRTSPKKRRLPQK